MKGYWKWRVQQKTEHTFRAQWKVWWWPFWRTVSIQGWGWKSYGNKGDAVSDVTQLLAYKQAAYKFRQAKWKVVEEGSYPE